MRAPSRPHPRTPPSRAQTVLRGNIGPNRSRQHGCLSPAYGALSSISAVSAETHHINLRVSNERMIPGDSDGTDTPERWQSAFCTYQIILSHGRLTTVARQIYAILHDVGRKKLALAFSCIHVDESEMKLGALSGSGYHCLALT